MESIRKSRQYRIADYVLKTFNIDASIIIENPELSFRIDPLDGSWYYFPSILGTRHLMDDDGKIIAIDPPGGPLFEVGKCIEDLMIKEIIQLEVGFKFLLE